MENKTPATKKQTVWVQGITFVSLLLVTITQNEWFMETFTQAGALAGMALTATTFILSFINPIGHKKNLEVLEVTDPETEEV